MVDKKDRHRRVAGAFFIGIGAAALFLDAGLRICRRFSAMEAQTQWRAVLASRLVGSPNGALPPGTRICLHGLPSESVFPSLFPDAARVDAFCAIAPQLSIKDDGGISIEGVAHPVLFATTASSTLHVALADGSSGRSQRIRQVLALQALFQLTDPTPAPSAAPSTLALAQPGGL